MRWDLFLLPKYKMMKVTISVNKKTFQLLETFWWGEQDSNLRSLHSRFTVCPRWPLEYLPKTQQALFIAVAGCKYRNSFEVSKLNLHLILLLLLTYWY